MKNLIHRVIRSPVLRGMGVYSLSHAINLGVPFLLMPIMTRYLTPCDYGITTMFMTLIGLLRPFTGFTADAAIGRQYFERERVDFPLYVTNSLLLLIGGAAVLGVALFIGRGWISQWTGLPVGWMWAPLVVSTGAFLGSVILMLWQARMRPVSYAVFQTLTALSNMAISLFLVVGLRWNWQGRILAQVVTASAFGILALALLFRQGFIKIGWRPDYLAHAVRYSAPLIPHMFGMWAISTTDRLVLVNLIGLSAAGVYSVGANIALIVSYLLDAYNQAWAPWLFGELNKNDPHIRRQIVKIIYAFDVMVLIGTIGFGLLAPTLLKYMVGKDFRSAGCFVIWLSVGYAFNAMYKMRAGFLFYSNDTSSLAGVTFITAALNVGIVYGMVRLNGAVGAAQGTMMAYLISFLLTWWLAARKYPMPWNLWARRSHA